MKILPKKRILFSTILSFGLLSCVQETHMKTVTFRVDMNGVEDITNVGIRGDFTPRQWNNMIEMYDQDKDRIYEVTLSEKTVVSEIEFKFVNQNDQYELKGQNNRVLQFEYKPENLVYEAIFNNPEGKTTIKK